MDEKPKTKSIYNPTLDDIFTDYDKNGEHPEHYILKAGEIEEFPSHIADLLEEKLVEKLLWLSMPANKNKDKRREELRKLIRV